MDDLKPRPQALLDWIHIYMMNYGGRPPTIREMIEGKIGKFTEAGVFTSKSVIRYNLQKLEDAGRIICAKDGTARNITVPGGSFGIPWNVLHGIGLEKYSRRLISVDCYGGVFTKSACRIIHDWYRNKELLTVSYSILNLQTNLWDGVDITHNTHLKNDQAHKIFTQLLSWDICLNDVAVITGDHFERLAAIGFGMAVFDPDEVFNGTE